MKRRACALALFAVAARADVSDGKFQGFRITEPRLLYRKPLLASGPAEGLSQALGAGTELLLVTATRSRDWAFVRGENKIEGWIPVAWIRAPYGLNPADVRSRFYPEEAPPEKGFDFTTDVKVWGDELLLEALRGK
jgi:hypothetical protein